jgi:ubiquinone/menaquinone biosynthesis C-methylase UbiE
VINLSPEKQRVFKEAFRVLKPSGRLMISDMVLLKDIPEAVKKSVLGYIGCISGAEMKNEYMKLLENAGFKEVKIIGETRLSAEMVLSDATAKAIMEELNLTKKSAEEIVSSVASIKVSATKPQN